ncbi:hypothetical protein DYB25_011975 [Aphanomyces astaci]|uniref:AB hydrolase-1 domain-containing protein n=1 Tax=Aphanomyces astaci TaxID=112090 RepID=A0A397AKD2_APHAT|nr:hypothetical protein DYB36_000906 [Aphanomyces astaci]RHY22703.1 hypothetical protein DYB25_011975 [Aphanomyces astaci]RHY45190.1 hypothetical protein DYB34_006273 [Aphanomyces astaci]RHY65517.1 hypothetical protein DYB38_006207 [Aphanomyces astaci]RHY67198.1 hypothetical protein DYB30_003818 [Aphanomyces astaci]
MMPLPGTDSRSACSFAVVRWYCGLILEEATVSDITWTYLDSHRETTEVVVVLHGFSSVKESMVRSVRPLFNDYRVIMPDLPGHGDTSSDMDSFRAEEQADRLFAFLAQVLGPSQTIHLVGCSMGGMISGVFAAKYPAAIASVTLICPAGITMPKKSPMFLVYEQTGENHMRVEKPEDFSRLQGYMAHRQRYIPGFILNFIEKRRDVLEKLMRDILLDASVLDDKLAKITHPCLVVWGDQDKILDISCLEVLPDKIKPQLTVKVVADAGHIVHQERHWEVAEHVHEFLQALPPSTSSVQPPS